jgi:hypothetical protein
VIHKPCDICPLADKLQVLYCPTFTASEFTNLESLHARVTQFNNRMLGLPEVGKAMFDFQSAKPPAPLKAATTAGKDAQTPSALVRVCEDDGCAVLRGYGTLPSLRQTWDIVLQLATSELLHVVHVAASPRNPLLRLTCSVDDVKLALRGDPLAVLFSS